MSTVQLGLITREWGEVDSTQTSTMYTVVITRLTLCGCTENFVNISGKVYENFGPKN